MEHRAQTLDKILEQFRASPRLCSGQAGHPEVSGSTYLMGKWGQPLALDFGVQEIPIRFCVSA